MKKHSFGPIVNEKATKLILGTMPGDKSLELKQYYANPTNQFWKLVLPEHHVYKSYDYKCSYLLKNGIAIWDVLSCAIRINSSDANIMEEQPNDFDAFLNEYVNIRTIFFNGTKAEKLFKKYFIEYYNKYKCIRLDSSSASPGRYVKSYDEKKKLWTAALS